MREADRDREFAEFVAAGWPRLRRAAYYLTLDHDEAEDLLQTVLVRVYVAWPKVRRAEALAYTRRALTNAYLDRRRARGVARSAEPLVAHRDVVPDATALAGDRDHLRDLLAPLSPRERAMVVARHYLDRSEAEVAADFGVSVGTVKSTVSRALTRIRRLAEPAPAAGAQTTDPRGPSR